MSVTAGFYLFLLDNLLGTIMALMCCCAVKKPNKQLTRAPQKVSHATQCGGRANIRSMGVLVEAMPSVKKAPAKVSPRALRKVDRLNENPEKGMAIAGSEDLSGHFIQS